MIGRFGFFLLAVNSMLIVEINTKQNNTNSTTKKELNSKVKDKQKIGNPTHPTPPHPPAPTPPHPHPTPPHPTRLKVKAIQKKTNNSDVKNKKQQQTHAHGDMNAKRPEIQTN